MTRILNRLCPHCSGRGFNWQVGTIVSRRNGSEVATTYKQGPDCEHCHGSGQVGYVISAFGWLVIVALALAASAFLIQPALHLLFD